MTTPTIVKKSSPQVIKNSQFQEDMRKVREEVHKFEDPFVGYAVLFAGLDADYAKSIGIR